MARKVSGRRVYVTFLKDGTVAFHPSRCTGERYRMLSKGSIHKGTRLGAEQIGECVLLMRDRCCME